MDNKKTDPSASAVDLEADNDPVPPRLPRRMRDRFEDVAEGVDDGCRDDWGADEED